MFSFNELSVKIHSKGENIYENKDYRYLFINAFYVINFI